MLLTTRVPEAVRGAVPPTYLRKCLLTYVSTYPLTYVIILSESEEAMLPTSPYPNPNPNPNPNPSPNPNPNQAVAAQPGAG